MNKRKVVIVAGTRPEAVKMAPVHFALRESAGLEPVLLASGQHREMLDQTFRVFGLRPDLDLNVMQPGQTLPDLTGRVVKAIAEALRELRPAAVLAQGDTTTVLGAALAAFYERVPFGHVEAGLRTYDFDAPWPEEMNRRLVSPVARWNFAPTEWSAANLRAERIPPERIFVTGNTVVDALLWMRAKLRASPPDPLALAQAGGIPEPFARRFVAEAGARWILVTGHRRESFGAGFENICRALAEIARRHPDVGILYPVHLNPNVREPVNRLLGGIERIALAPPIGYEHFVWLMDRCHFILSDSGGVQEEAPSLGKPVLVMRDQTERPEGVAAGTCRLVGTDPGRILAEVAALLGDAAEYRRRGALASPYGDGAAARRIREVLEKELP